MCLFFPPKNVSRGDVTFSMLAKIGNEEVGRWITMPVMYPGVDKLFTHRNTCSLPCPQPHHFDGDAIPGLTGISACNSEYGTKCVKSKSPEVKKSDELFGSLLVALTYSHMQGVCLLLPTLS